MVRMLGRLEPVCLSETVEERMASLEEQLERKAIYTNHLQAQAALVAATAAAATVAAAAAAAGAAGFNVETSSNAAGPSGA
jgi:hypothetical protein